MILFLLYYFYYSLFKNTKKIIKFPKEDFFIDEFGNKHKTKLIYDPIGKVIYRKFEET